MPYIKEISIKVSGVMLGKQIDASVTVEGFVGDTPGELVKLALNEVDTAVRGLRSNFGSGPEAETPITPTAPAASRGRSAPPTEDTSAPTRETPPSTDASEPTPRRRRLSDIQAEETPRGNGADSPAEQAKTQINNLKNETDARPARRPPPGDGDTASASTGTVQRRRPPPV